MNNIILDIKNLNAFYGKAQVLHNVSLEIMKGEKVVILGRNGMGKSTLLKSIMAVDKIRRDGSIMFEGRSELVGKRTSDIARHGIGYVPQGWLLFRSLSVDEHLTIAYRPSKTENEWNAERIYDTFPEIARRRKVSGTSLSGGEQQILAICRALVTNSDLLLMDEPSEGISTKVLDRIVSICEGLTAENKTLLLVEQNLGLAVRIAERVYILVNGTMVHEASTADFKDDKEKQSAFLGV